MRVIEKIQRLPTKTKKLLVVFLVAIIGFFLFRIYLINIRKKIELLRNDGLVDEKTKNAFTEIFKESREDLQKIERSIQEFMEKVKEKEKQKNETENQSK